MKLLFGRFHSVLVSNTKDLKMGFLLNPVYRTVVNFKVFSHTKFS